MFIRPHKRFKNGKWHTYYSVVENRRCTNGQHVQRQVLYLGEISAVQEDEWQQALDKFNPTCQRDPTLDLFASPRTLSTAKVRTLSLGSANFSGVVRKPIPWGAGILPISVNLIFVSYVFVVYQPMRELWRTIGGTSGVVLSSARWRDKVHDARITFRASGSGGACSGYPQGEKDSASSCNRSTSMATSNLPASHALALES